MKRIFLLSLVPTLHVGMHTSVQGNMMKRLFVFSLFLSALVASEPEVIHGHQLPPEPDPAVNNSTLLGIDVNNNGVRDDVERYIIYRFSKEEYPKTRTALALQYAWAMQKIIENPTRESAKYSHDALDCEWYWFKQKQTEQRKQISKLSLVPTFQVGTPI
jgi:hypothetical protein